jgi:hypothetical protein
VRAEPLRTGGLCKSRGVHAWRAGTELRVRSKSLQRGRAAFRLSPPPNFTLKLVRPGFGPAAELPTLSPAWRRHAGCRSRRATSA